MGPFVAFSVPPENPGKIKLNAVKLQPILRGVNNRAVDDIKALLSAIAMPAQKSLVFTGKTFKVYMGCSKDRRSCITSLNANGSLPVENIIIASCGCHA